LNEEALGGDETPAEKEKGAKGGDAAGTLEGDFELGEFLG